MSASPGLAHQDPAHAAWAASGSPEDHAGARTGRCARCLQEGSNHVSVTAVAGENFTGFSDWLGSPAGGLCASCAWVYRTPALRNTAHLITADPPSLKPLNPADLYACLLAGAPTTEEAITVPLRPGRKHVLPAAQWGLVAVDDVVIQWTSIDGHRLQLLAELRERGATSVQLRESTPPWSLIKNSTPPHRSVLLATWAALEPWRNRGPWMDLALLATSSRAREDRS